MKLSISIIALVSILFTGCNIKEQIDMGLIEDAITYQQKAWNDGDIDKFMEYYWNNDSLIFIGKRGLTHGWETTLANYKKSYPTPQAMGKLDFELLHKEMLGPEAAITVGKWTLYRTDDTLGGYFSLTWRKLDKDWRIIIDHTN